MVREAALGCVIDDRRDEICGLRLDPIFARLLLLGVALLAIILRLGARAGRLADNRLGGLKMKMVVMLILPGRDAIGRAIAARAIDPHVPQDRKSTRLNSSH